MQIGEAHINHCEDYAVHFPVGKNRLLAAVMDGCTMGTDSYWIATSVGKILRKAAKEIDYQEFITGVLPLPVLQKQILQNLFTALKNLKNSLQLTTEEMLCTLNLMLLDTETRICETITIGDGLIVWNGHLQEFEQNNTNIDFKLHRKLSQCSIESSFKQLQSCFHSVGVATPTLWKHIYYAI
jgi:hypothetical protein